MSDTPKRLVGEAAIEHVVSGMVLGLGTGSTIDFFLHSLGDAVNSGLNISGVPTSSRTESLCLELGIPLTDLDSSPRLDLTIDGADELDSSLNLIKGGGGALLREKIVAYSSDRMLVIADQSKRVPVLGSFPLPIEVDPFGVSATRHSIEILLSELSLPCDLSLRLDSSGSPFFTDGGHYIIDASLGSIDDVVSLSLGLTNIPGVIEHGLFVGLASSALIGSSDGVSLIEV